MKNKYAENVLSEKNVKTKKSKQKLTAKRLLYFLIAEGIYMKMQAKKIKKQLRAIGAY